MFKKIKKFLTRPEVIVIIASTLFTMLISTAIGIGGYLITKTFWGYFLISLCLQFIIFAIVNTVLQRRDTIEGTKIINEQLEALAKFTIRLACAYCKQVNSLPIQLNKENRFKCESCNQVNSVKMQFFAAQVTTPLNKVVLPAGENESIEFKTN